MPDIPPVLFEHIQQTTKSLGRIEANQETALKYIGNVHKELKDHVEQMGAHGLGQEREETENLRKASIRSWNNAPNWIVALTAIGTILFHLFASHWLSK